jgi:nitric oxide dioxygenase
MPSPASLATVRQTLPADDGSSPLLLASSGIGCRPIIGILHHLVAIGSQRHVTLVHADRSVATHPLRLPLYHGVSRLVNAQARIWYEEPHPGWPAAYTGCVDLSKVELTADVQAYICGPVPFIESIRQQLLDRGVSATAIQHELSDPELAA